MTIDARGGGQVGSHDVGFGVVCLLAVSLVLPVQVASIIVFDASGADTLVPTVVFTSIVPALVLASVPALLARRFYSANAARMTLAAVFLIAALAGAYLSQFYGMCGGAGC